MAKKNHDYIFEQNNYIESLTCSIQKFFGLKPSAETIPEIDEIFSQKYRHIVVVELNGLEEEFLNHDLTHRDFMRRHVLNMYPTVLDDEENVKQFASYGEIIEAVNNGEKMKAFEILPENYKNISEWASAVRKTCKRIEKTFTYTRWDELAEIVKIDHKDSNGVYKAMNNLNAEMAFLCEDLEETVFVITTNPEKIRKPVEDGVARQVPVLWYENKPKRSGLIIYYAIIAFIIIFLVNIMM